MPTNLSTPYESRYRKGPPQKRRKARSKHQPYAPCDGVRDNAILETLGGLVHEPAADSVVVVLLLEAEVTSNEGFPDLHPSQPFAIIPERKDTSPPDMRTPRLVSDRKEATCEVTSSPTSSAEVMGRTGIQKFFMLESMSSIEAPSLASAVTSTRYGRRHWFK